MSCHDKLEESVGISLLLDFYGELLKSRQRELLELYFSEDLSLSEIASRTGITRQGALDGIRRGEKFLRETEEKLGLVKRFRETGETAATLVPGSPGRWRRGRSHPKNCRRKRTVSRRLPKRCYNETFFQKFLKIG